MKKKNKPDEENQLTERVTKLEEHVTNLENRQVTVEIKMNEIMEDTKELRGLFHKIDVHVDELKKNQQGNWMKRIVGILIILVILMILRW